MAPIPTTVIKRDGTEQQYDSRRIMKAMHKTGTAINNKLDLDTLDELVDEVEKIIAKSSKNGSITRDEIDEAAIQAFTNKALFNHANEYKSFNERRKNAMKIQVATKANGGNSTDINLLIENQGDTNIEAFDPTRIASHLKSLDLGLSAEQINIVTKKTENRVLDLYNNRRKKNEHFILDTATIRAFVATSIADLGAPTDKVLSAGMYGMPKEDLEQLMHAKTQENANVATNNPEAVGLAITEGILKKYALEEVFDKQLKEAHLKGEMHIHDLGYITRVYCSGHSPAFLKKYGLHLDNLDTASSPAKHAITLSGHITTFLASMQAYYAGALGLSYLNLEFAPFLKGMKKENVDGVIEGINNYLEGVSDKTLEAVIKPYGKIREAAERLMKSEFSEEEYDEFVKNVDQRLFGTKERKK